MPETMPFGLRIVRRQPEPSTEPEAPRDSNEQIVIYAPPRSVHPRLRAARSCRGRKSRFGPPR